jgi:hypothetical protein
VEIDRDAPKLLKVSFGEGRLGLGLSDAPGSGGGVVVSEVAAGSAAALAGVLVGSWCLSLNALDVSDLDCRELSRQIGSSARPLHMTLALPRSAHDGAGAHDGGEGAHDGASAHNGGGAGAHDGAIEPCLDDEVLGEVHTCRLGAFDLLGEMRTASLLAKAVANRADALPAHAALHAATLAGARALGLESEIGSIEVGKAADLIAIDLSPDGHQPALRPLYQPASQLVYAAGREHVSHVWVAGQALMQARDLLPGAFSDLNSRVDLWQNRLVAEFD